MDNQVEGLLSAEQAVQDVLKELEALKKQVGATIPPNNLSKRSASCSLVL